MIKTIKKVTLSILGGSDVVVRILTPIILAIIWSGIFGFENIGTYIIYLISMLASLFRGIKIGWLNKND